MAGKRDAGPVKRLLRPGYGRRLFPHADGIVRRASMVCGAITQDYRKRVSVPAERYQRLYARLEGVVVPKLGRVMSEYQAALAHLQNMRKVTHYGGDADAPASVVFSARLYFFLWLAFAVFELPFNMMVFQVLGENLILTTLVAVGISVLVPTCGHIIGKQLRIRHYWGAAVFAVTGVGLLLACAYFRMTYVRESSGVSGGRPLLAFLAIGVAFLVASTFASRYSEPGEDENASRGIVDAKIGIRNRARELAKAEEENGKIREEIQATYEHGQTLEDQRRWELQGQADSHTMVIDAYWRGFQRAWEGTAYPEEAGFGIEPFDERPLWPPREIEERQSQLSPASTS